MKSKWTRVWLAILIGGMLSVAGVASEPECPDSGTLHYLKSVADFETILKKLRTKRHSLSEANFESNLMNRDEYFKKLIGMDLREFEEFHRAAFTQLMAGSPLLKGEHPYDFETMRQMSFASAVYESLARTPGEGLTDRLQSARKRDPSMGPFQAYAGMTAEALSSPQVRAWVLANGDDEAKKFVKGLGANTTRAEIEKGLNGIGSPVHSSATLSLLGKMRLTAGYMEEVDFKNPVVRRLPQLTQRRIWADTESADAMYTEWADQDNKVAGGGRLEREAKSRPGAVIDVPAGHPRLLRTMDILGVGYLKSNQLTLPQ